MEQEYQIEITILENNKEVSYKSIWRTDLSLTLNIIGYLTGRLLRINESIFVTDEFPTIYIIIKMENFVGVRINRRIN